MKISARNRIKGTVTSVVHGPVSAMVKVDIGGGNHITATVTAEAVDELGIVEGKAVWAVFKASSVMLGSD